jgi:MoxR-like ATPase
MSWSKPTLDAITRLGRVKTQLKELFTGRDQAIDLLVLATTCQEHLLMLGPPGTAKTELVTRFTELVDARRFYYLLTRFTEPSELFGPLDMAAFQNGEFRIVTDRMLPDAQIAFLDEVFQGSSAILNALLTLVNERVFHNGPVRQPVPLVSLLGASNALPDDPGLVAFADRFTVRVQVDPVPDDKTEDLIDRGWELECGRIEAAAQARAARPMPNLKAEELALLHGALREVSVGTIQPVYAGVVREMRAEGLEISDRRVVKGLKLVAGAALLRKADAAEQQDLWPLCHIWSRPEEADALRAIVEPRVREAGGPALDPARKAEEIAKDLAVLAAQVDSLHTEAALGAHLMSLNRLRREALRNHRGDGALRKRVDDTIQRVLGCLEGPRV